MMGQLTNSNCDESAAKDRPANMDVAELDHILADLDIDAEPCKIATNLIPIHSPKPQGPERLPVLDGTGATVSSSLPLVLLPPSDNQEQPEAPSTSLPIRRSSRLQAAVDGIGPALGKPWRQLWAHEKLALSFQVAEAAGAVAFTLNLSSRVQRTLISQTDPARLMSHYLNRECKRRLGSSPRYSFIFEFSPSGRLHLHGVVVPDRMDEEYLDALDQALMLAGGSVGGAQIIRTNQNYLDRLSDGLGWAAYTQKNFNDTARLLGTDKITFISNSLKRLCRSPGRGGNGDVSTTASAAD
jgi:hypothetical protein